MATQEVAQLREQIVEQDKLMVHGVFLLVILMMASFIAAVITGELQLYKLPFVLAVTMTFWITRGDFLIHRAGAYIRSVEKEEQMPGWESFKAGRGSTKAMFLIDLLAATALIWLLWQCGAVLVEAGQATFVWFSSGAIVLGVLLTVFMIYVAKASK